ncbi:hypothetical protein Hdeb2414_s1228g00994341 [Helianthus debilis subsp. tardiflorus]
MEVAPPINPTDFNFNSSAYTTTLPPTPRLMNNNIIISAPTSPARSTTNLHHEFDQLMITNNTTHQKTNYLATIPFAWEEKPGVPKQTNNLYEDDVVDFAFDVSGELSPYSSVTAEDLFQGGVIKPTEMINNLERERGRERKLSISRSRRTQSLPPLRGPEQPSVPANIANIAPQTTSSSASSTLSASGSGKGSKKWSFKDLFLFRSASDGRALDKDPLKKHSAVFRKHDEDFRNSSLRYRSGSGHGSGHGSKRRGRASAHELHYNVNRAVSNDMKKKTFLPYKQGILGRLAFNPTVHALSNGFGFSHNN